MNVDVLWANFLSQIKEDLTTLAYDTWFNDTKLYELKEGKAIIIVPMQIHKKHLADKYSFLIIEKLNNITGTNFELEFLLENEIKKSSQVFIIGHNEPDFDSIGSGIGLYCLAKYYKKPAYIIIDDDLSKIKKDKIIIR